ncbi:MAG: hypothetical protein ISS92_05515 [Candidatus Omnitrophica bacterium]|nr:hypothetical protein [Candidatus Omnitrophota bacterium]
MKAKTCIIALFAILLVSASFGFTEDLTAIGVGPPQEKFPYERTKRVSMDFENADLKTILKAFSKQTGVNFIASNIIEDKVITVYLNDVSVQDALSSILEANGLFYEKQKGNVYLIKPAGTAAIKTITRVYKLSYIQVYNMALGSEGEGFESTSARTIITGDATTGLEAATTGPTQAQGAEGPESIIKIIESMISPYGKIATSKRTNSLIITDIPESFAAIEKVIEELDVEPAQVMIEAEIIETTTDAIKRIGVEYGTATQTASVSYGDLVAATPFPFTNNFIKEVFGGTLLTSPPGTAPTNFTYGTLTAADTQIVLQLFEQDQDTKFLSRPRVMTINNEPAVIRISANTAIGVESTSVSGIETTTETAERVETGVILKVIPRVNAKGDIFMYVEPSIGRAAGSTFFTQFMDPQVRSASSTVMVKDGDTVIIAGLIKTDNYKTIRKIPFLGDIPIIGEPFRSRYRKVEDTELLIFITPHIVRKRGGPDLIPKQLRERERAIEQSLGKYSKK